jgi:putative copper export protein/mono/diheme cytochrome c family protein/peroxiredoxin
MLSDLFEALVRGAHYASVVSAFGCFVFLLAVARPAWRGAGAGAAEAAQFQRFLLGLAKWSVALALTSGLLWLWVVTAGMSGQPLGAALSTKLIGTVLTATGFGRLWLFRFGVAILLAAFLWFCRLSGRHANWPLFGGVGGLLSGIILGSLVLGGHGADDTGIAGVWHLGADILHLLAAGGWLGALIPLIFVLRQARRPAGLAIAQRATLRFSTLGIVTVATLIASGLVNSWYLVGNLPSLFGTPYGELLLVKLALFAAMLCFAAVNRARLTPRLLAPPSDPAGGQAGARDPLRRLSRNAMCETALGLVLLVVVGALVHLKPGLHDQPVWPFPVAISSAGVVLTRAAWLVLIAAAVAAALGLAATALAVRRQRWLFAAASVVAIVLAGGVGLRPFVVEAFPTSFMHSPIRYGTLSVARGMPLYAANCVLCHGRYGYGDGPAAPSLPIKPADLTGEHLFHHGEGTLFWWISHGIAGTPMPAFADKLRENERWDLLNFLRAQADAEHGNAMSADSGGLADVVAPDFAFQIGHETQETLKQQRGRFIVLLVLFSDPGSLQRLHALDAAMPQLERDGVRVIAVSMAKDGEASGKTELGLPHLSIAETDPATVAAYGLFRRTASVEGVPPMPSHMEFLIDPEGYLRYRWSPAYGPGWDRMADLVKRIDALDGEKPRPPAPEGHVH